MRNASLLAFIKHLTRLPLLSAFLIGFALPISPVFAETEADAVNEEAESTEPAEQDVASSEEFDDGENDKNPLGCKDTAYSFYMKTLTLTPAETGQHQTLYFFHNITDDRISLSQMRTTDSNRSLYLNHTIEPNQWAVLATNEKSVRFICAIPGAKKPYGAVVSCQQTIHPCASTHVRFGLNNRGSFWMVGNTTRNSAIQAVLHYGVIP